jgi:hypothetical protein
MAREASKYATLGMISLISYLIWADVRLGTRWKGLMSMAIMSLAIVGGRQVMISTEIRRLIGLSQ